MQQLQRRFRFSRRANGTLQDPHASFQAGELRLPSLWNVIPNTNRIPATPAKHAPHVETPPLVTSRRFLPNASSQ